jgi:hypothetical protein
MGVEPVGMGCFGVEAQKLVLPQPLVIQPLATTVETMQKGENAQVYPAGTRTSDGNHLYSNALREKGNGVCGKTVGKSEIPPDLREVIDHWSTLPPEVKQTILTLVKHARQRKREKVV